MDRNLQTSFLLAVTLACFCAVVYAGETESSSQASVNSTTSSGNMAASSATRASSTESSVAASSEASGAPQSEAKYRGVPVVTAGNPSGKGTLQVVPAHRATGSNLRRGAHWQTRYWNQKAKQKSQ